MSNMVWTDKSREDLSNLEGLLLWLTYPQLSASEFASGFNTYRRSAEAILHGAGPGYDPSFIAMLKVAAKKKTRIPKNLKSKCKKAYQANGRIRAVKEYRAAMSCGLKEAVDVVKEWEFKGAWKRVISIAPIKNKTESKINLPPTFKIKCRVLYDGGQIEEAVKLCHELSGYALKTSREIVAAWKEEDFALAKNTARVKCRALYADGYKIQAIKLCWDLTKCGLKEAKDTVEAWMEEDAASSVQK